MRNTRRFYADPNNSDFVVRKVSRTSDELRDRAGAAMLLQSDAGPTFSLRFVTERSRNYQQDQPERRNPARTKPHRDSRYEPTGPSSANVSLEIALVSASTGRVIELGQNTPAGGRERRPDLSLKPWAFCPRAEYLTESKRLLVVWVVQRMAEVGADPLVWDAGMNTGEDAFWVCTSIPCCTSSTTRNRCAWASVIFMRRTRNKTLDIAYAQRAARPAGTAATCW